MRARFLAAILLLNSCTDASPPLTRPAPDGSDGSVCSGGRWTCFAKRPTRAGRFEAFAGGQLGAPDLADAYALDTSASPGATIAIVDAFGYPKLESDLGQYRSQ